MANKHTTLVSLFDDIADAIRELLGTWEVNMAQIYYNLIKRVENY